MSFDNDFDICPFDGAIMIWSDERDAPICPICEFWAGNFEGNPELEDDDDDLDLDDD